MSLAWGLLTRKEVRVILDQAELQDVHIVASGSFDEYSINAAVQHRARIDAFGVGTKMGVAADMPYLDMAYKMVWNLHVEALAGIKREEPTHVFSPPCACHDDGPHGQRCCSVRRGADWRHQLCL
jgi:hypothetical protein